MTTTKQKKPNGSPSPSPAEVLAQRLTTPRERSNNARERRYQAERDLLVANLSKIAVALKPLDPRWSAHITTAARSTLVWSEIVCIHSPVGQLAWGLPMDRAHLFAHLEHATCEWDGHGPSQRDARLRQLLTLETLAPQAAPVAPPRRRRTTKKGPRR